MQQQLRAILRLFKDDRGEIEDGTLDEYASWVLDRLETETAAAPFVLLVDGLSEVPEEIALKMERYLLAPVANLPRGLVILSSRPPMPLWRSPIIALDPVQIELKPFTDEEMEQLVEALSERLAHMGIAPEIRAQIVEIVESARAEILDFSQGTPGVCVRTVQWIAQDILEHGQTDMAQVWSRVIDELLIRPTAPQADQAEREAIRKDMERLAVFEEGESFREEMAAWLLADLESDTPPLSEDLSQARASLQRLARHNLIHWEKGGYQLDPAIRRLVANYLARYRSRQWQALHRRAAAMYAHFQKRYPRYRDALETLRQHHEKAAAEAAQSIP